MPEVRKFTIDCDGVALSAVLEKPWSDQGPLVIVIHGFTGYKEERHIVAMSQMMNGLGFATLRVDMYGHGESGGRFHDHTLLKWMTNALAVTDYARGLDGVTELYLCGHSQGGLMAMLAAAMERDRIAGLIPLSPAAMIPDGARRGALLGMTFDPRHVPEALEREDGESLGGNYIRAAQLIDVEAAIDAYDGPVLIVHGDADEAVPLEVGVAAAKRYRHCDLAIIPGDTHCYDHHLDQAVEAVRAWLTERNGK